MLKAAIINTGDDGGGAELASYRLLQGLAKEPGVQARMVVKASCRGDERVRVLRQPGKRVYRRIWQNACQAAALRAGLRYVALDNWREWRRDPFVQEADILNFHNLHGNYINYRHLSAILGDKAAVLTLHDMWALTGHCSYSFECERWKSGCGRCPHLDIYPNVRRDATAWEHWLKKRAFARCRFHAVSPSRWLAECARQSPILGHFPVHVVPYGLDVEAYRPREKSLARAALNIPLEEIVFFAGATRFGEKRKGADLMAQALASLPESLRKRSRLLAMGAEATLLGERAGMKLQNLGTISGDDLKALALSAADILAFASRADNLPLMLQEALACGLPAVAFRVGGVPDLVRHLETGFLAESENVEEFRARLIELAESPETRRRLSENARRVAVEEYSLERCASAYKALFAEALEANAAAKASKS